MSQTPKQQSQALKLDDLPPCVDCSYVDFIMIAGYDDKMRCHACNRKHLDQVENEQAASDLPILSSKTLSPKLEERVKSDAFRAMVVAKNGPRGGFSTPSLRPLARGETAYMNPGGSDHFGIADPTMSDVEKKAKIVRELKKSMGLKR